MRILNRHVWVVLLATAGCFETSWKSPPGDDWVQAEAGARRFTCGLRVDGTVDCWGSARGAAYVVTHEWPDDVVSIAAGYVVACAVRAGGELDCTHEVAPELPAPDVLSHFDYNQGTGCSLGTTGTLTCAGGVMGGGHEGYVDFAVGDEGSVCALDFDGEITCWFAEPVAGMPPTGRFEAIDAGHATVYPDTRFCALADDSVTCWVVPDRPGGAADVIEGRFTAIDVGTSFFCGLADAGTVTCQSFSDETALRKPLPDDVYVQITAGTYQLCGVTAGGRIRCVQVCQPGSPHGPTCRPRD